MQSTHPEVRIDTEFDLDKPVVADHVRLAQLLSNLLGNALTHGAKGMPVSVKATATDRLEIAVCNQGNPILPEAMEQLFFPFSRGEVTAEPAGARARALHLLGDRPRPWRQDRRHLHPGTDLLHLPACRWDRRRRPLSCPEHCVGPASCPSSPHFCGTRDPWRCCAATLPMLAKPRFREDFRSFSVKPARSEFPLGFQQFATPFIGRR